MAGNYGKDFFGFSLIGWNSQAMADGVYFFLQHSKLLHNDYHLPVVLDQHTHYHYPQYQYHYITLS